MAQELGRFRLVQPRLADWVRKALQELHAGEIGYRDAALKELYDRQTRLRQQQDMLYSDRLDGRISAAFYDAKRTAIKEQMQSILEGVQRHSVADKKYFELGINLFELSQQAPDIFRHASLEKKRKLLTLICQEMYTAQGTLVVRFTDVFYTLSQLAKALNGSKESKSIPSSLRIFALQKSPYFDLQKGAPLPEFQSLLA